MRDGSQCSGYSLKLLGPPEIIDGRKPVSFARRKSMALLAYLALEERIHARDSLTALLWPECDQARARGNLRSSIHELDSVLGAEAVVTVQDRVRLDRGLFRLDADALLRNGGCCAQGPGLCPACRRRAEEAVRAWGGGFMAGFTLPDCPDFDDWQFRWSTRLREAYVAVLPRLIRAYRDESRLGDAEEMAERWIEVEPYVEDARRSQLELLLGMGMPVRAAECLAAWERVALSELGRPPSPSVTALLRSRGVFASSGAASPGPLDAPSGTYGLFGREGQIRALSEAIGRPGRRLHSLVGTGGVGKTALAKALLAEKGPSFPGGAVFVDLSEERDARRIPYCIAVALRMRELGASPEEMTRLLCSRLGRVRTLLVLDNLEQLPGAGSLIEPLLEACRGLVVIVTSREGLGAAGERVHHVEPLAYPSGDESRDLEELGRWPALDLLLARARRANPSLEPRGPGLHLYARLCERLDGIPLAIELGASLLGVLGAEELLSRLERRLGLPHPEDRPRPRRHRSLGAILDWSYELLAPFPKLVYAALAVFRGDFDPEAAEAVLGCLEPPAAEKGREAEPAPILTALEALARASLVKRRFEGGRCAFSSFQTIRDHAGALLESSSYREALRDRFASFYLARAESAVDSLRGPGQVQAIRRLEADQGNFEASLERFAEGSRVEEGLRLCVALEWAWFRSGRFATGIRCLESALGPGRIETRDGGGLEMLRGACLRALGWLRFTQGAWHEAHARYLEALPLLEAAGGGRAMIRCLADLGVVERWLGNVSGGDLRCCRAVQEARSLGDPGLLATALVWRFGTTGGKPGTEEQREGLEEAIRLGRLADEPWITAHAHESLGDLFRERGLPGEALPHFERALKGFTALEDEWMIAWTLEGYGMNDCFEGELESARARLRDSLRRFLGLGAWGDSTFALGELGLAAALAGDREESDFLLGAFSAIKGELGLRTLAPSFESSPTPGRPGLAEALAEAVGRNSPEWRRGLAIGFEDLKGLLSALGPR